MYTKVIKNHMQKVLDAINSEKQSVATNFCMIRDVTDVPYESNLFLIFFLIFVNFLQTGLGFLSFVNLLCNKFVLYKFILPFLSLVMETSSST